MQTYHIHHPQALRVQAEDGSFTYGASQHWYRQSMRRNAGCGPTACAELMWYLARTRETASSLADTGGGDRAAMLELMDAVWDYVTPGAMGLYRVSRFCEGAVRYGRERGVALYCASFPVAPLGGAKRDWDALCRFLCRNFQADVPVAFLNLSNAGQHPLSSWHWTVIAAFSPEEGRVQLYDQGRRYWIDLHAWLLRAHIGGGFAACHVK